MKRFISIADLKQCCPLPDLMKKVGLGAYVKPSCRSPFREDTNPSWGVFKMHGRWMYKDFATGELGDEIGLLAHVYNLNPHSDFTALLKIYKDVVGKSGVKGKSVEKNPQESRKVEDIGLGLGSDEQIQQLSDLRKISAAGLEFAQDRGVLVFGGWQGYEVYGVQDQSRRIVELRRLNGEEFPAYGRLAARKSHAIKGSQKNWPIGLLESKDFPSIALAEGLPDFLALHQYVVDENAEDRVAPVAMLSSACSISTEALPLFSGKHVRIYPHIDEAGVEAADKWQKQLIEVGAIVDIFDFSAFSADQGEQIKDLCEYGLVCSEDLKGEILP